MTDVRCPARIDLADGPLRCAKNLGHDGGHAAYDGYRVITWMPQRLNVAGLRPPLYVNHKRSEPEWGDVIRSADPDDDDDASVWMWTPGADGVGRWLGITSKGEQVWVERRYRTGALLLLVDGETGKPVQP